MVRRVTRSMLGVHARTHQPLRTIRLHQPRATTHQPTPTLTNTLKPLHFVQVFQRPQNLDNRGHPPEKHRQRPAPPLQKGGSGKG